MSRRTLRTDPTRTTMLRRKFMLEMRKRFDKIGKAITELIVDNDALGIAPVKVVILNASPQIWKYQTNPQKLTSFKLWLQNMINTNILAVSSPKIPGQPWTSDYVWASHRQGLLRAYTDANKPSLIIAPEFAAGSQSQFLMTAFSRPQTMQSLQMLYTGTFDSLKGITATMDVQMSRVLSLGLVQGDHPYAIARELKNTLGITKARSQMIARTEIIRAHAEGELDAFETLGVEKITAEVEWSVSTLNPCPECEEMDGKTFTIEEARGLIPLHPNCKCSWNVVID